MAAKKRRDGLRLERMQASPRYRDGRFHNTARVGPGLKSGHTLEVVGGFLFDRKKRFPPAPLGLVDPRPVWAKPAETGLRATWRWQQSRASSSSCRALASPSSPSAPRASSPGGEHRRYAERRVDACAWTAYSREVEVSASRYAHSRFLFGKIMFWKSHGLSILSVICIVAFTHS